MQPTPMHSAFFPMRLNRPHGSVLSAVLVTDCCHLYSSCRNLQMDIVLRIVFLLGRTPLPRTVSYLSREIPGCRKNERCGLPPRGPADSIIFVSARFPVSLKPLANRVQFPHFESSLEESQ